MTKEELVKEAEEYVKQNYCEMCVVADVCKNGCIDCFTVQVYIASAEPREKQIEELQHKIDILQGYLDRDVEYQELQKENAELKKNYEDSLVAYGVLKAKVDLLAQPSPLESMQDVLLTTQKIANEKQKEQLTKAKEIITELLKYTDTEAVEMIKEAKQFITDSEVEK